MFQIFETRKAGNAGSVTRTMVHKKDVLWNVEKSLACPRWRKDSQHRRTKEGMDLDAMMKPKRAIAAHWSFGMTLVGSERIALVSPLESVRQRPELAACPLSYD